VRRDPFGPVSEAGPGRLFILSGPIHSGKTTFLQELCAEAERRGRRIEGYLSPAVWEGRRRVGYDLWDIRRGTRHPFLRTEGKTGGPRTGKYFLIPETLDRAREIIRSAAGTGVLVVDELGSLELDGGGVWPAFEAVMDRPPDRMLLVIRDSLLDPFRRRIRGGDSARLLEVGERNVLSEILAGWAGEAGPGV